MVTIILTTFAFLVITARPESESRRQSASQMRAILQALAQYADEHGGRRPDPSNWERSLLESSSQWLMPEVFTYPGKPGREAYLLLPRKEGAVGQVADEPILCESPEVTGGDEGNVAYADNRVEFLTGNSYRSVVAQARR